MARTTVSGEIPALSIFKTSSFVIGGAAAVPEPMVRSAAVRCAVEGVPYVAAFIEV